MTRKHLEKKESPHTLLLIDDDIEYLEITKKILELEGHKIVTASDVNRVLTILHKEKIDLILLDFYITQMNGEELVKKIREFNNEIQIIFYTRNATLLSPREIIKNNDVQGYIDTSEGIQKLLLQIDICLKKARRLDRIHLKMIKDIQAKADRLLLIAEVGYIISGELNIDTLLQTVYAEITEVFHSSSLNIILYKEKPDTKQSFVSIETNNQIEIDLDYKHTLEGFIIKNKIPVFLKSKEEIISFYYRNDLVVIDYEFVSIMGIPLFANGTLEGVLILRTKTNVYDQEDLSVFSTIGTQVAVAFQNARLFEKTKKKAEESAALAEIGREIASKLDLSEVLNRVVTSSRKYLQCSCLVTYLIDTNTKVLSLAANDGDIITSCINNPDSLVVEKIIINKQPVISNSYDDSYKNENPSPHSCNDTKKKIIAVPLIALDEVIGIIAAVRMYSEQDFLLSELDFLMDVSREAALAIKNAELYTQAKQAQQEAENANLVKTRFLANTSHELRTPLNAIINFSWLVLQGGTGVLNSDQVDLIERIEKSGRHLLELINEILDLAKIEAGYMEIFVEEVDISQILLDAFATIEAMLVAKPIVLISDIPPFTPLVFADKARLKQILLNLLSNAVKFTNQGSIKVVAEHIEKFLLIKVIDTGIGMDEDCIEKIFSEFVQVENKYYQGQKGTGLGLPISRRFTELMGGKMWAESVPGKGSVFSFTLPTMSNTSLK